MFTVPLDCSFAALSMKSHALFERRLASIPSYRFQRTAERSGHMFVPLRVESNIQAAHWPADGRLYIRSTALFGCRAHRCRYNRFYAPQSSDIPFFTSMVAVLKIKLLYFDIVSNPSIALRTGFVFRISKFENGRGFQIHPCRIEILQQSQYRPDGLLFNVPLRGKSSLLPSYRMTNQ